MKFNERMSQPRKVNCLVCGDTFTLKGAPATKKVCKTCRPKWEADRSLATKPKQRKKAKRGNASVRSDKKVRSVRRDDSPATRELPEAVRDAPVDPPAQIEKRTNEAVPEAAKKTGSFEDACNLILAPEQKIPREGFRLGILGATGAGKTTLQRAFLNACTDRLTLIHDEKVSDAQFAGAVVERFEDAPDDAQTLVFHGDVFAGRSVPVEYVASGALHICRATRQPVRLVVDELDRACTEGGMKFTSQSLSIAFTQGRQMGLSVIWSTQAPQRAPLPAIDQASALALCRLGPRALNYLDERLRFDSEFLAAVPKLEDFEFVLWIDGRPWDGVIYRAPFVSPPISSNQSPQVAQQVPVAAPGAEPPPETESQDRTAEIPPQTNEAEAFRQR